ncbi:MAG: aldolase [Betaproteobacteria bacterium]|nr:aldolase [Betaproteobacteria bacterium]MDE2152596.1 aldolase [Betaproteobacteria bacterium]MDE2479656.1 aldolase [Betaproteobacteria bacterium]
MDWIQITNVPEFAAFAVECGVARIMVDLERIGKQERQGGLGTFISDHRPEDVAAVRAAVPRAHLLVRINPWHAQSAAEVEHAVRHGADSVMLPMFEQPRALQECARALAGRARLVALLETRGALDSLDAWAGTEGLDEIYVGLNDLHRQLGCRFMFEPLADGTVERVARTAQAHGRGFGFGGIARLDEGLLPGRVVLAEHLRLGSGSVILSRTFNREMIEFPDSDWRSVYRDQLGRLRHCESVLRARSAEEIESDRLLARDLIRKAALALGTPGS